MYKKGEQLLAILSTLITRQDNFLHHYADCYLNSLEYKIDVNKEWIKAGSGGKFLYLNLNSAESAVSEPEFEAD